MALALSMTTKTFKLKQMGQLTKGTCYLENI